MDIQPSTSLLRTSQLIALDLIDDDGNDMRRIAAAAFSDAALTASIRRRGVLQPIGVRPLGPRFQIVFGRRRLNCARTAGLAAIPAIIGEWSDDELRSVQATENLQRQAPHPIDVWRTVCDLVDAGASIADAAAEIGLGERDTRRMERLGRLDPGLLKLVEVDMPREADLRIIANAPPRTQRTALRGLGSKATIRAPGDRVVVPWREIALRCEVQTIPRTHAIFATANQPAMWNEDLFAQPDDPERFTTTDIAKFMKLQEEALRHRIEEQRADKRRIEFAEFNAADGMLKLPKGFRLISTVPNSKPGRTECVFTGIRPNGTILEVLAVDVVAKQEAERKSEARAAKRSGPATTSQDDDGTADEVDGDAGTGRIVADVRAVSKAGLDIIGAAKTAAIKERLLWIAGETSSSDLLRLTLIALLAKNVELRPYEAARAIKVKLEQLLLPGGGLAPLDEAQIKDLAAAVIGQLIIVSGANPVYMHNSGPAAEWIGAAIGAEQSLPRFDTEAFLACVSGTMLRGVADAAGIKSTGSVAALRQKLIGNLANWRPDEAQFGAPGPRHAQDASSGSSTRGDA